MANFNQNLVFQGLGTITITVPTADTYKMQVNSTIPTLTNGGGVSALVCVIKQNASTLYTGTAGASGAAFEAPLAANDVISFVFSSANAVDAALNAVKSAISISEGV